MHIIVMIFFFALWLYVQAGMGRAGINPISRSQMRYLRKKSRNLNTDIDSVPYNPRHITISQPKKYEITEGQKKFIFYLRIFNFIIVPLIILFFFGGFKYIKTHFLHL